MKLLVDIDILLIVENGIRGGICHAIHWYAKANSKYMKDYEESSYLGFWVVNNLYGWAMSQKLPVDRFKWVKNTSQFNKDFIKNYNKDSDTDIFSKLMFNVLKKCTTVTMICHFTWNNENLKSQKIYSQLTW